MINVVPIILIMLVGFLICFACGSILGWNAAKQDSQFNKLDTLSKWAERGVRKGGR